jgi:sulfoxide reductase heme-binding subunit YedZ
VVLKHRVRLLKTGIWILGLTPLGWAVYRFFLGDGFGANPIAELQLWGGLTSLTALLVTLAVTPLRRLTGWNDLQKARRLVGLFAFFYVTLHFLIWIGVDQFFAWEYIIEDIAERPYILIGFVAFLLLIPLAITSTKGWIKRLGKNWVRLHRLVYVSTVLGIVHYFWVTKADNRWPTFALGVWGVAMGLRAAWWLKGRRARSSAGGSLSPRSSDDEPLPTRS